MRRRGKFLRSKENSIAQEYFNSKIKSLASRDFAVGFSTNKIPLKYEKILLEETRKNAGTLIKMTKSTQNLVHKYAGYVLAKNNLSDMRTGVVIVGFGEKELCPQLCCFEMDGIVDGRLKHVNLRGAKIAKVGRHAEILGFAQDDVIQSFVSGIDHDIKSYYEKSIRTAVRESAMEILKVILKDTAKAKSALTALQTSIEKIYDDVKTKANDHIKSVSSEPIRSMIRSMPKQELAMLAYSLIELTSLKRKVSPEQETVGGDVDLAVISKDEGFVWVKRKHYFPPGLNSRFFARHYNGTVGGSNEPEK